LIGHDALLQGTLEDGILFCGFCQLEAIPEGYFPRLSVKAGPGLENLREQPAGTMAEGAQLATTFHNQERFGCDSSTSGTAAFAATNWQPD